KTPASYFRWGNELAKKFQLDLSRLGMKGFWKIRDVWRQQDLQQKSQQIEVSVPHHGVKLFRVYPSKDSR
ncbi:MAG: hypothetical protein RI965_1257, partial [Bacteroidota bacterium]